MAQTHMNVAEGEHSSAYDVATDATDLATGSHNVRVIFADALDKSVAAQILRDMAREIEHDRRAWPLAT